MQTEANDEINRKIESGEYFREARNAYAHMYLDPMVERYLFGVITFLALLIFLFALVSMARLFPLVTPVPFTYMSNDLAEELPVISALPGGHENPNAALKRFLVTQYLTRRESYDIARLELNVRAIKSQSTPEVFDAWQRQLDPGNPESPITLYQRHSTRSINVLNTQFLPDGNAEVLYEAIVDNRQEQRKTRMMANVAFRYADVTIDQNNGQTSRLEFLVTDYRTRRLQE